jgi:hypothetical protein
MGARSAAFYQSVGHLAPLTCPPGFVRSAVDRPYDRIHGLATRAALGMRGRLGFPNGPSSDVEVGVLGDL